MGWVLPKGLCVAWVGGTTHRELGSVWHPQSPFG